MPNNLGKNMLVWLVAFVLMIALIGATHGRYFLATLPMSGMVSANF